MINMKNFIICLGMVLVMAGQCLGQPAKVYRETIGNDEIIIGDDKSVIFVPQVKFTRWNKESYLIFKYAETGFDDSISEDGKIITDSGPQLVKMYAEDKNFKFIIILKEKPVSNVFTFYLDGWEDFNFWYQDTLENDWKNWGGELGTGQTLQEFLTTHHRPDDVIGSYAIYHKTKKHHIEGQTNYGTGKFNHIYRPKWVDADGNWVWAILHIENGIYTNTCPQDFLDVAKYPVKTNDTFGQTDSGASTGQAGSSEIYASPVASPASTGTMDTIHIDSINSNAGADITVGLYLDDGSPGPATRHNTETESIDVGAWTRGFHSFDASNSGTVTGGINYWIAANGSVDILVGFDSEAGTNRYWDTHTYGVAWPATFTQNSSSGAQYSIYATFTPSGVARRRMIIQ